MICLRRNGKAYVAFNFNCCIETEGIARGHRQSRALKKWQYLENYALLFDDLEWVTLQAISNVIFSTVVQWLTDIAHWAISSWLLSLWWCENLLTYLEQYQKVTVRLSYTVIFRRLDNGEMLWIWMRINKIVYNMYRVALCFVNVNLIIILCCQVWACACLTANVFIGYRFFALIVFLLFLLCCLLA